MSALGKQMQQLRIRIEMSFATPFSVLLSSALRDDGRSECARGLAETMAAAGHNTLMIELDDAVRGFERFPRIASLASDDSELSKCMIFDSNSGCMFLSLAHPGLADSLGKRAVELFIERMRRRFDAIIVDAPPIAVSSSALLFASACDTVVMTARSGRPVRTEDHASREIIERENLNFLGVVTLTARTIADAGRDEIPAGESA